MGVGILLWMIDTLGYLLPRSVRRDRHPPVAGRALHPVRHRRPVPLRHRLLPDDRPGLPLPERPGPRAAIGRRWIISTSSTPIWFAGWLIAVAGALRARACACLSCRASGVCPPWRTRAAIVAATLGPGGPRQRRPRAPRRALRSDSRRSLHALEAGRDRRRPARARTCKLTYFYQAQDQAGRRAKDMVEVLGRRNPRLRVRTVDPDKQPTVADTYGVRIYNAAVLETDGPPDPGDEHRREPDRPRHPPGDP